MEMSLDANFVGQASPLEAAKWFVVQPWVEGFNVPPDAVWTVTTGEAGPYVTTDGVVLQAFQSPNNQTWNIASARRCASLGH